MLYIIWFCWCKVTSFIARKSDILLHLVLNQDYNFLPSNQFQRECATYIFNKCNEEKKLSMLLVALNFENYKLKCFKISQCV